MIETLVVATIVSVAAVIVGRHGLRSWRTLTAPAPDCETGPMAACNCASCPVASSRERCEEPGPPQR